MVIRRGDIFYADLRPVIGSEQGGIRPVLIIQIDKDKCNIIKDSVILLEQLRTIDKQRLKDKVCHLDDEMLKTVDKALCISLELDT